MAYQNLNNNNGNGNGSNNNNNGGNNNAGAGSIITGGRNWGLFSGHMSGARVAGNSTYIPAHSKNGTPLSQRCTVPVMLNYRRGNNGKGTTDTFKIVGWGGMAEICAKFLSKGRALDAIITPRTFKSPLYNADGSLRYDNQGQIIEIPRTVMTIVDINLGEESQKFTEYEIQAGIRPRDWNVRGTDGNAIWAQEYTRRQCAVWQMGDIELGFARVVMPSGQNIQINAKVYQDLTQRMASKGNNNNGGYQNTQQDIRNNYGANPNQNPQNHQQNQGGVYQNNNQNAQQNVHPMQQNVQPNVQNLNDKYPVSGAGVVNTGGNGNNGGWGENNGGNPNPQNINY